MLNFIYRDVDHIRYQWYNAQALYRHDPDKLNLARTQKEASLNAVQTKMERNRLDWFQDLIFDEEKNDKKWDRTVNLLQTLGAPNLDQVNALTALAFRLKDYLVTRMFVKSNETKWAIEFVQNHRVDLIRKQVGDRFWSSGRSVPSLLENLRVKIGSEIAQFDGIEALADWMNSQKVPLNCIDEKYWDQLLPLLTYVDLRNMDFGKWTEEQIHALINKCTKMETLRISTYSGVVLETLPAICRQLKFLDCSSCTFLKQLPDMPDLVRLEMNHCTFKEIPQFLKLQHLRCLNCYGLVEIPYLPELLSLRCGNCCSIRHLPLLPKLRILACAFNNFESFPCFPELRALSFNWGRKLATFPILPKLRVYHDAHSSITTFPAMPNLRVFNSSYNKLETLPSMDKLREIHVPWSEALTSIGNMPKLKFIDKRGCKSLPQKLNFGPNVEVKV